VHSARRAVKILMVYPGLAGWLARPFLGSSPLDVWRPVFAITRCGPEASPTAVAKVPSLLKEPCAGGRRWRSELSAFGAPRAVEQEEFVGRLLPSRSKQGSSPTSRRSWLRVFESLCPGGGICRGWFTQDSGR